MLTRCGFVSCRGLEAVRSSDRIYLEAYTSQLLVPCETLVGGAEHHHACCRPCEARRTRAHPLSTLACRRRFTKSRSLLRPGRWWRVYVANECLSTLLARVALLHGAHSLAFRITQEADSILDGADTGNVSFLVVGDPYGCVPCFLRSPRLRSLPSPAPAAALSPISPHAAPPRTRTWSYARGSGTFPWRWCTTQA